MTPAGWAAVAALLLAVPVLAAEAGPAAAPSPIAPAATSASNFSGNFSLAGVGPEADVPAGAALSIEYELRDAGFVESLSGLYVHVPATQAEFNVSWGTLRLFLSGSTESFNSTNWTGLSSTNTSTPLPNETVFPDTGDVTRDRAELTTEGLALTSAEPPGALTVELRWRWLLTSRSGPNETGAWIPSDDGDTIATGEYAQLASGGRASVATDQVYSACLAGAIDGRDFVLQALVPDPHLLFASATLDVPLGASGSACLNVSMPSWLAPQQIVVYLWNLIPAANGTGNASTYLLYLLKVQVVPGGPGPPTYFGVPLSTWYTAGVVAAGLAALAIAVGVVQSRGRRRVPRRPATGSPAPAPPVEPPSEAPPWSEGDPPPRTGTGR